MTRRRLVTVAVAVALLATGGLLWAATRPSPLARVRADLDRTDPGWRFHAIRAERLADPVPDGDNPVLVAVAAMKLIPPEYTAWCLAGGLSPEPDPPPYNRRPAGEAAWRAADEATRTARRIKDLSRGMDRTTVPADPFATLLPNVQTTRYATDLLLTDAVFCTLHGDPRAAADDIRAMLHLGRAVGRDPFLICHLVRSAHWQIAATAVARSLAQGEWPDDALAAVQADLQAAADPVAWATALRDYRAGTDLEMDAVASGDADIGTAARLVANRAGAAGPNLVDRVRYRLVARADHAEQLVRLTELLDIARRPAHEWQAAADALPLPPDDPGHLFGRPTAALGRKLTAGAVGWQARLRAAVLLVGCERFRVRNGRWPDTLGELPAEFTPADPTDPYTGRPLLVKRLADGLAVYSAGPDKQDGGGAVLTGTPGGKLPGSDIGFRLWDVPARGLPAAP